MKKGEGKHMKKIKKIMICTIIFLMLNIIALPVLTILIQDLNINSNSVLKLLLNNSDAIIISIIGAFIYDKLKITLTGNKSDSNK